MNWRVEIQDNKHHVISDEGDIAGVYRTRLPALLEVKRLTTSPTVDTKGPWAKAFDNIRAAQK